MGQQIQKIYVEISAEEITAEIQALSHEIARRTILINRLLAISIVLLAISIIVI